MELYIEWHTPCVTLVGDLSNGGSRFLSIILCFCIHLRQTIKRGKKCLVTFSEVETNQVIHIFTEEATAWHCPYSDMLCQPLAEVQVVLYAVLGDIKQDIICSLRISEVQSKLS